MVLSSFLGRMSKHQVLWKGIGESVKADDWCSSFGAVTWDPIWLL